MDMDPKLLEEMKDCRTGTALIKYRLKGRELVWILGANPKEDTEKTLNEHLKKWIPEAEFLGWAIK